MDGVEELSSYTSRHNEYQNTTDNVEYKNKMNIKR